MLMTVNYHETQESPNAFLHVPEVWKSMNRLVLSTYLSEMAVQVGVIVPQAI